MAHAERFFKPCTDAHSIEAVVFALDFHHPLAESSLKEILERVGEPEIQSLMPYCLRQGGMVISNPMPIFPADFMPPPRSVEVGAFFMDALDLAKAKKMMLIGEGVKIVFKEYETWENAADKIDKLLRFVFINRGITFRSASLKYYNIFSQCLESENSLPIAKILSEKSQLLPPNIYRESDSQTWETSHVFRNDTLRNDDIDSIITEISASYARRDGKRDAFALAITSAHQYLFKKADLLGKLDEKIFKFDTQENQAISKNNFVWLRKIFDDMHERTEEMFSDMLSEEAARLVGLSKK